MMDKALVEHHAFGAGLKRTVESVGGIEVVWYTGGEFNLLRFAELIAAVPAMKNVIEVRVIPHTPPAAYVVLLFNDGTTSPLRWYAKAEDAELFADGVRTGLERARAAIAALEAENAAGPREPAQPNTRPAASADERAEFESWGTEFFNYGFNTERDESGDGYTHDATDTAWEAWKERASGPWVAIDTTVEEVARAGLTTEQIEAAWNRYLSQAPAALCEQTGSMLVRLAFVAGMRHAWVTPPLTCEQADKICAEAQDAKRWRFLAEHWHNRIGGLALYEWVEFTAHRCGIVAALDWAIAHHEDSERHIKGD